MQPMKLVFYTHALTTGGVERVAATLASYWAELGWQITIITDQPTSEDFYPLPHSVRRLVLTDNQPSRNQLEGLIRNIGRVRALRKQLKTEAPDVAIAMMPGQNCILALARLGLPLLAVGSEHVHPPFAGLSSTWKLIRKVCYRFLDAVTALTEPSRELILQNTRAARVSVIPNPVTIPMDSGEPRLDPEQLSSSSHLVLAAGRLSSEKGFDLLIQAFVQIKSQFPDWNLVILGDGNQRNELEQQIRRSGSSERILLPGTAGNIGAWYQAADLFVLSSHFEGFGNTLMEALAHGTPAVSTDCEAGPRYIIRHEQDGVLIPVNDAEALAAALARLMADDSLRGEFASRASECADRFSTARVAALWEALFLELTDQNSGL
jgi:glycosyltransferase involved in cell wall biosynthesis